MKTYPKNHLSSWILLDAQLGMADFQEIRRAGHVRVLRLQKEMTEQIRTRPSADNHLSTITSSRSSDNTNKADGSASAERLRGIGTAIPCMRDRITARRHERRAGDD